MTFRTLASVDLARKRVLLRLDLNVPIQDDVVTDATRIERVVPTIRAILDKGGIPIVLAHFDRPKGKVVPEMSLRPVVPALAKALGQPVIFVFTDWADGKAAEAVANARPGDVLLLENTRYAKGEEANDPGFAALLAGLGDIYVNDAFSAAHRAHASTEGVAHRLPAVAGLAMQAELDALTAALEAPKRPVMAIVGGAKVSTKLDLLGNLTKKVDRLVIGGGMANTFLAAQGKAVGKSLCEHDLADTARAIMAEAKANGCEILLPVDALVAREFKANAAHRAVSVDAVAADEMILDIGPRTIDALRGTLSTTATVLWNGPFGAFELTPFDTGTNAVARVVADMTRAGKIVSVAGGGDTVAALNQAGAADAFTYVSTAGGAFLEWLEGKALPGVEALRTKG
jgi:phosphoglycerate kinase